MISWAGIALSCIADNAPFSCTKIETLLFDRTIVGPTEHSLEGHTPINILKTVARLLERPNGRGVPMFAISYPIALPQEQREMLRKDHSSTHDHCTTFLKECRFNIGNIDTADCLFLDLTPGQVAAKRVRGKIVDGGWQVGRDDDTTLTVLGDVDEISLEEVMEKLILPTVPSVDAVQCVAILKPESAFSNLESSDLNLFFYNIPVKWLSIADLSYGAACMMEHEFPFSLYDEEPDELVVEKTLAIQLADGQFYALLPEFSSLPTRRLFYFTTSKDSQTTASLQFSKKRLPCGKAVLEDLTPRVRGAARIKVVVQCDLLERTRVTIQELGSSQKTVMVPEDIGFSTSKPIKVMFGESKSLVLGNDGVVGELPE